MVLAESDTGCFLFFSSGYGDNWIEIWLPTVGSNVYGVGMQEYTIQRSNRRCHVSDREFVPGESYYSALIAQGSSLLRQDFSEEIWERNRPGGVVGWWVSTVPQKRLGRPKPAPVHVLLAALEVLLEDPLKGELAYLLTLLLIRRRVFRRGTDGFLAIALDPCGVESRICRTDMSTRSAADGESAAGVGSVVI